ncbi:hypothetical protein K250101E9_40650 [Enterocloster aldenensis]
MIVYHKVNDVYTYKNTKYIRTHLAVITIDIYVHIYYNIVTRSRNTKQKQPGQTIPHKPINRTCEPQAIDTQD